MYCIDVKTEKNFTVIGSSDTYLSDLKVTKRVEVYVKRCVNDSKQDFTCASNEEINKWIQGKSIKFGVF